MIDQENEKSLGGDDAHSGRDDLEPAAPSTASHVERYEIDEMMPLMGVNAEVAELRKLILSEAGHIAYVDDHIARVVRAAQHHEAREHKIERAQMGVRHQRILERAERAETLPRANVRAMRGRAEQ